MPFTTARQTIIQAASSDKVIFQFRPPLSAIVLVMFRVSRYQKYVVAELFSHSGSTTNQAKENQRDKMKSVTINISLQHWLFDDLVEKISIVFLRIWFRFISVVMSILLIYGMKEILSLLMLSIIQDSVSDWFKQVTHLFERFIKRLICTKNQSTLVLQYIFDSQDLKAPPLTISGK